jgi:hypothetical protein
MNNEYEVAAVIELGAAEAVVLGVKSDVVAFDTLTGELSVRYIESMED